jgi:thioredoxin reductase (NADPH)
MFDWDVVIIGGGPAGLTAGLYLGRANRRTLLLDKDSFGGYIRNVESVDNYPGFADGIAGAELASGMVRQATKYGLQTELAEVTGIELFSGCRWVGCAGGQGYTTEIVIIAGGSRNRKLAVPGEESLRNKGVFSCALCDGGQFAGRTIAVCGGGDAGVSEALYMTKIASRVVLIEAEPKLTATAVLQERAYANPKLEIICGVRVDAITGDDRVKGIQLTGNPGKAKRGTREVDGVLVQIGLEPNTDYLDGIVPLDSRGQIIVNGRMETEVPYILAAGDIRSGSPRQVVTAVGDGAIAAITAQGLLQESSGQTERA